MNNSGEVSGCVYFTESEPGKIRMVDLTCVIHKTSGDKIVTELESVQFSSKYNMPDVMFQFKIAKLYFYVPL